MPLTVLSDSVKAQLQQERDRLTRERQAMIQSVVAAATVEIDQTLVHLEGLLGVGAIDVSTPPASAPAQSAPPPPQSPGRSISAKPVRATGKGGRGKVKASEKSTVPTAAKSKAEAKAATTPVAKGVKRTKAIAKASTPTSSASATPSPAGQLERFEPKRLKAQFGEQTPQAAIMQVFQESPTQAFSQDDLINRLYDEFPPQDLMRARRSVSLTLMWSTKRGELVRVQEDPALYQLAPKRG